jgi:hypothetical protein
VTDEELADLAVAAVAAAASGEPLPEADSPEARRVNRVVGAIAAARPGRTAS